MTEPKTDHAAEAESYLRGLDDLEAADAYVAVMAAQAHSNLAQLLPAREMVELQRQLLASMLPSAASPTPQEQVKAAMEEADALARAMPGPEDQVKPAIEEPTEFGSVVRAAYDEHADRVLWVRAGKGWFAETQYGFHSTFAGLHDPEVLRVGIDEPEPLAQWETELLQSQERREIAAAVLGAMDVDQYLIDAVVNARPR